MVMKGEGRKHLFSFETILCTSGGFMLTAWDSPGGGNCMFCICVC